jgi:uncharacterized membrane protein YbhN (UPF0104 family)
MPEDTKTAHSRRPLTFFAIKLSVSIGLLALLLSKVDIGALWASARQASAMWLIAALAVYFVNILASTWRWRVLLDAQDVQVPRQTLLSSYLVAGFFNNFLPSNIGGDVVRIRDTAKPAGSKTLATTVVLVDRGLGLIGLILVAALGATMAASDGSRSLPIWPSWLWAVFIVTTIAAAPAVLAPATLGRLLRPLTVLHPGWIGQRIGTLTTALSRFRSRPGALAACFGGAIAVQMLLVLYYLAVVYSLGLPVGLWDLAVVVPLSFLAQMLPVSMNGFGVREATFSFYLTRIGLPLESALLLPLVATALVMLFSLSGAAAYLSR